MSMNLVNFHKSAFELKTHANTSKAKCFNNSIDKHSNDYNKGQCHMAFITNRGTFHSTFIALSFRPSLSCF